MLQLKATSQHLKWQLSGSFNGSEAVKPDTAGMIGIKEELEHSAFSPHPRTYGERLVSNTDSSLKPGDSPGTALLQSVKSALSQKHLPGKNKTQGSAGEGTRRICSSVNL